MDVIQLNVGGEVMMTTRETLCRVPTSTLAKLFNSRWEDRLDLSNDADIVLDLHPELFRHLLQQLRQFQSSDASQFSPPHSSSPQSARLFKMMLQQLGLDLKQSSSNAVITINAGGSYILTRQSTLASLNSTALKSRPSTKQNPKGSQDVSYFVNGESSFVQDLLKQLHSLKKIDLLHVGNSSCKRIQLTNGILKDRGLNRK